MPDFFETFDDLSAWDDTGWETEAVENLYITSKHATDGTTSLRANYDTVYHPGTPGFFLQWIDTVDGGDPSTQYWLTYSFYLEDWARVWGNGDRTGVLSLPVFAFTDTFDDYTSVYLRALSQTTGEILWSFPFDAAGQTTQSITADAWHTIRMGLQYDDGTNTTTSELWIDNTQVATELIVGGAPHFPNPPMGVDVVMTQAQAAGVVYYDDLTWSVTGDPGEPSTTETGDGSTTEQWVKIRDKDSGDNAALVIEVDPTYSDTYTDVYVYANIYVPSSLLSRLVTIGNSQTQTFFTSDGSVGGADLAFFISHSVGDGSVCRWKQSDDTAFGTVTAGWHTIAAHLVAGDPNLEMWIDGVQYNQFYRANHTSSPSGFNEVAAEYPFDRSGATPTTQTDMWIGVGELAVSLTDWVDENTFDLRFPMQSVEHEDIFYLNGADPPTYPPYWAQDGPGDDVATLEEGFPGPGPGLPERSISLDFIAATTTVFTPTATGTGNANINAPFISPTTQVFSITYTGDQDADAPFIAPTTTVFTPFLLGPSAARISQAVVEVLLAGDPDARISQVPVEVLLQGDPYARISQAPVEVLVTVSHESVHVTWIP